MYFYFNGYIYEEVDGMAMGSPLAPFLANIFIGHQEQHRLIQEEALLVLFYKRSDDGVFCMFLEKFLDLMNT